MGFTFCRVAFDRPAYSVRPRCSLGKELANQSSRDAGKTGPARILAALQAPRDEITRDAGTTKYPRSTLLKGPWEAPSIRACVRTGKRGPHPRWSHDPIRGCRYWNSRRDALQPRSGLRCRKRRSPLGGVRSGDGGRGGNAGHTVLFAGQEPGRGRRKSN